MPTLLHIDSSPLETSVSRELTREFIQHWTNTHPDGRVLYRDLSAHPPAPVDTAWIAASFTPPHARQPEQKARLAESDELIAELEQADQYVIGVAMHNFSIPSVLKLWIDQVVRAGRTFRYGSNGAAGLLTGKEAIIIVASGGIYEPGTPNAAADFVEPYLRHILSHIGVNDVTFIKAGGTSKLNSGSADRPTLLRPALERVKVLAA